MHGETPEFKRCCFCLPLRRGLLAWGYTKLVLNFLTIAQIIYMMLLHGRRSLEGFNAKDIAILTTIHVCLLTDLSFSILFIVAGHKKSVKLLNICYVYNMVWLGLVLLANCSNLYVDFSTVYRLWHYVGYRAYLVFTVAVSFGLAFGTLFVQIYLILLIRSEMKKLRDQSLEMQFSNHLVSGEPQCILHNGSDREGTGKKDAVQECCSGKKEATQDCCTGKKELVHDCCPDEKDIV